MLAETRQEQPTNLSDSSAARRYVRGRQTPAGGFSFYRSWGVEEPAISDTFYAVAALALLDDKPEDSNACAEWLLARQRGNDGYADIGAAWYATETLARLDCTPRHDLRAWLAAYSERLFDGADDSGDTHEFLLDLLRYVELRRRFELELEPRHRSAIEAHLRRLRSVRAGAAGNLTDSAIVLRLARAAGLLPERRLLEFAQGCEDPVLGFRATVNGKSAVLDTLAAGVAILSAFNVAPRYRGALLARVAACQQGAGGFGRQSGAVATLRDTWLALFILKRIENL